MKFNAACSKLPPIALAIATISLGGCATGGFEPGGPVCPPVVEYSREFQARVAGELALLPEGSAIAGMMGDYAVMRDQARVCS